MTSSKKPQINKDVLRESAFPEIEPFARRVLPSDQFGDQTLNISTHRHTGRGDSRVNIMDLIGLIEVVNSVPTDPPKFFWQQIKLYYNSTGPVRRVYFYVTDSPGVGAWRYASLT